MVKRKWKMVDASSGIRISMEPNLNGEMMIFVDLTGNSYAVISPRRSITLAKFFVRVAKKLEISHGS